MSQYYYTASGQRRKKNYAYQPPTTPVDIGWKFKFGFSFLLLAAISIPLFFVFYLSPGIGMESSVVKVYYQAEGQQGKTPEQILDAIYSQPGRKTIIKTASGFKEMSVGQVHILDPTSKEDLRIATKSYRGKIVFVSHRVGTAFEDYKVSSIQN